MARKSRPAPEPTKQEPDNFHEAVSASRKEILEKIVDCDQPRERKLNVVIPFSYAKHALDNYVTLDWQHIQDIAAIIKSIRLYVSDRSRKRPYNIIMQAEPGSGKSYFIKCLAASMSELGIKDVTFNMTGLEGIEDLVQPLEAVRNLKVADKLPILFLDEFDSSERNYSLLLPLLWDGELHVRHRELHIGKVVVILAGSGENIESAMTSAKGMKMALSASGESKLNDLLSRINGGEFHIPALDAVEHLTGRDRRVDKVCLTLSLLSQRFGTELEEVPWALLRFIARTRFRYGVRSIAHLVDCITRSDHRGANLGLKDLGLPLDTVERLKSSSLAFHIVAEDGPAGVTTEWLSLCQHEAVVVFQKDQRSSRLISSLFEETMPR